MNLHEIIASFPEHEATIRRWWELHFCINEYYKSDCYLAIGTQRDAVLKEQSDAYIHQQHERWHEANQMAHWLNQLQQTPVHYMLDVWDQLSQELPKEFLEIIQSVNIPSYYEAKQ